RTKASHRQQPPLLRRVYAPRPGSGVPAGGLPQEVRTDWIARTRVSELAAVAYRLAWRSGFAASLRSVRPAATIFCYHNVVPDALENPCGDGPLHLGLSRFRTHLDWIASAYRVVPLREILTRLRANR